MKKEAWLNAKKQINNVKTEYKRKLNKPKPKPAEPTKDAQK